MINKRNLLKLTKAAVLATGILMTYQASAGCYYDGIGRVCEHEEMRHGLFFFHHEGEFHRRDLDDSDELLIVPVRPRRRRICAYQFGMVRCVWVEGKTDPAKGKVQVGDADQSAEQVGNAEHSTPDEVIEATGANS